MNENSITAVQMQEAIERLRAEFFASKGKSPSLNGAVDEYIAWLESRLVQATYADNSVAYRMHLEAAFRSEEAKLNEALRQEHKRKEAAYLSLLRVQLALQNGQARHAMEIIREFWETNAPACFSPDYLKAAVVESLVRKGYSQEQAADFYDKAKAYGEALGKAITAAFS